MNVSITKGPVIKARTYVRKMRGESQCHLVICSDSKAYVIKSCDNAQHERVPANEWLAAHLASLLGLPTPDFAIVEISEKFTAASPDFKVVIAGQEKLLKSGLAFGSELVGGLLPGRISDIMSSPQLSRVSNLQDFYGALLFDMWVCNTDSRQAVFFYKKYPQPAKAYLIDHGNCFGSNEWQLKAPRIRHLYHHRFIYKDVTSFTSFEPWLSRIESLSRGRIWEGFSSMPTEWYANDEARAEALLDELYSRRQRLRDIVLELIFTIPEVFPLWGR